MSTVGPGSDDLIAGAICAGTPPNAAPRAMHAHRLWISLWMSLGNQRENSGHPGGNAGVTSDGRVGLHSQAAVAPGSATAAVHGNLHSSLGGRRLSPGSTDPMTTTSLYLSEIHTARRLARRTALCRTADAAMTNSEQEGTGEDRP